METETNQTIARVAVVADPDPWLTLQESAKRVKAHEATLRREMKAHRLRFAKIGGRKAIRIRASWLNAWLEHESIPIEIDRQPNPKSGPDATRR